MQLLIAQNHTHVPSQSVYHLGYVKIMYIEPWLDLLQTITTNGAPLQECNSIITLVSNSHDIDSMQSYYPNILNISVLSQKHG